MLNLNVNKLSSLIESKKQSGNLNTSNISSINNVSNNASMSMTTTNLNNTQSSGQKQIPPFKVQSFPGEKFPLFKKKDFYHYDRKFHNELPSVISPPISFHYASSTENFCSFDMMTMMFGLKKSQEILTDPRLNTKIHKDFINNSLNLIFPDRMIGNDKMKKHKEDILKIIDSKDESELLDEKSQKIRRDESNPFYLRRSTLMSSALNLKKKNSGTFKTGPTLSSGMTTASLVNLKKNIENSFETIKKIKEGVEHTHKKGVVAKNVYQIFPFFEFPIANMSQVIFPNDPLVDLKVDEEDKNFVLPEKFLLKKNESVENEIEKDNGIYKFYKKEDIPENIETNDKNDVQIQRNKLRSAEYYSFEKEFQVNISNPIELFNRHFIFLDKKDKTANVLPIQEKVFLKKYRRNVPVQTEEDEYDTGEKSLGRKRERDVIVVPKQIERSEVNERNERLKENGIMKEFIGLKISNVNWETVEKVRENIVQREFIQKEKKEKKETLKEERSVKEEEEAEKEGTENEDVDLFDLSDEEENNAIDS